MNGKTFMWKQLKVEMKRKHTKDGRPSGDGIREPEPLHPDTCDLTVRRNKDGDLIVKKGRSTFPILNAVEQNVMEGEVWTFIFYPDGRGFAAVASKKVTDAPADVPEPPPAEKPKTAASAGSKDIPHLEKELKALKSQYSKLESELKTERSKITRLINDNNRLRKENGRIPALEEDIRQRDRTIEGLKTNISGLEKKIQPPQDVAQLMKERDGFKAMYDAQVEENRKISESVDRIIRHFEERAKCACVNDDATLLGPDRIHCVLFREGRYRAYMAPRKGVLRFIPDDDGNIECTDRFVTVPQIGNYLTDCSVRTLATTEEDGGILIRIGDNG